MTSARGIGATEGTLPGRTPTTTPGPPKDVGSLRGDETILLVEDEELLRPLIREALESYGYTVLEAAGGDEALEIAEREGDRIALLITDIVMPGLNGRELADRLVAKLPTLEVLYTSGYPEDTILRHGVTEGIVAYIEKPYLPDELARKIRELLVSPKTSA